MQDVWPGLLRRLLDRRPSGSALWEVPAADCVSRGVMRRRGPYVRGGWAAATCPPPSCVGSCVVCAKSRSGRCGPPALRGQVSRLKGTRFPW